MEGCVAKVAVSAAYTDELIKIKVLLKVEKVEAKSWYLKAQLFFFFVYLPWI